VGTKDQIAHALIHGPASIGRLGRRGWAFLVLYLACAAVILGLVGWQAVVHKDDILGAIAGFFVPENWRFAATRLLDLFLASQLRDVVVNAVIGAALVVVQVLLFPIKEKVSATFEREGQLTPAPGKELPLWLQALEEAQLFVVYLTAQMCIFWVGYPPDPVRKNLAVALSYLYLFASFGIDFLSPILQRHTFRYSTMFKVFATTPLAVLAFGAVFALPVVLAGKLITARAGWSMAAQVTALFGVNVLMVGWAAVAGTWVGARLLPRAQATRPPSLVARGAAVVLVAAVFSWNAYRFGAIGASIHRKGGILKCDYSVDWTSADVDLPSWFALLRDEVEVSVSVEVTIRNPTPREVAIERNRLEVKHGDGLVAQAQLTPVTVAAGGSVRQRIAFPVSVVPSTILKGRDLLRTDQWSATLWLEVAAGFEFPVFLIARGG
jgi:hypothetical protein